MCLVLSRCFVAELHQNQGRRRQNKKLVRIAGGGKVTTVDSTRDWYWNTVCPIETRYSPQYNWLARCSFSESGRNLCECIFILLSALKNAHHSTSSVERCWSNFLLYITPLASGKWNSWIWKELRLSKVLVDPSDHLKPQVSHDFKFCNLINHHLTALTPIFAFISLCKATW